MKRTPWTKEEDEYIVYQYEVANGAVLSYPVQAQQINDQFHKGKNIRNAQSVARRFLKLYSNKI